MTDTTETLSRPEARVIAKRLLAAGFHHPEIVEDVETGRVRVQAHNRCWNLRHVETAEQGRELLATEGRRS